MRSGLENVAQMPPCQAMMLIMSLFVSQGKRKEIKCLNLQWAPSTQALQTFDSRANYYRDNSDRRNGKANYIFLSLIHI